MRKAKTLLKLYYTGKIGRLLYFMLNLLFYGIIIATLCLMDYLPNDGMAALIFLLCYLSIISIIIKRAHDIAKPAKPFIILFIVSDVLVGIVQFLNASGITYDTAGELNGFILKLTEISLFLRIAWFITNLYLCLTPAKQLEKSANLS